MKFGLTLKKKLVRKEETDQQQDFNQKKSFNQYKDEIRKKPHPRTIENIKALAKYRGGQSGFNYAEAFFLIKKYIK